MRSISHQNQSSHNEKVPSELKCKWIELFLVPAVRYNPCRFQLAVYQVANINLLYIIRDRNIAIFYKNVKLEMESAAR